MTHEALPDVEPAQQVMDGITSLLTKYQVLTTVSSWGDEIRAIELSGDDLAAAQDVFLARGEEPPAGIGFDHMVDHQDLVASVRASVSYNYPAYSVYIHALTESGGLILTRNVDSFVGIGSGTQRKVVDEETATKRLLVAAEAYHEEELLGMHDVEANESELLLQVLRTLQARPTSLGN